MSFKNKLFAATPIHSLVFARIALGLLILMECCDEFGQGIHYFYIAPKFYFTYYGFDWIAPLPGQGMYWLTCLLAACAIFITLGLFYRTSLAVFTIGFTYIFLIDQAYFMNHFYMILLFTTLLFFMPANRYFSLDAYFNPRIKTETIPFWPIFLLRAQMEIILIFAGLVKINYDWLVRYMPLKIWLPQADVIAPLHYLFMQDWLVIAACYGVVLLHIVGGPLLLVKRVRLYVFLIYCAFHLLNAHIFYIGSFPWLAIALSTVFFDPDWPKKFFKFFDKSAALNSFSSLSDFKKRVAVSLMVFWIITQVLIPLRYLLYPGHVSWSGEGQRFAWRMKLNSISGGMMFFVTDEESNQKWRVDPTDYLTPKQHTEMQCRADMILQFAHHLDKIWEEKQGYKNVKVTVDSFCSLNGRKFKEFIDPNIDLTKVERTLGHNDWVRPFDHKWQ